MLVSGVEDARGKSVLNPRLLAYILVALVAMDVVLSAYSALRAPFPATVPMGSPTAYRNIYLHIPLAWASLLMFTIAFIAAIGYVVKGKESLDRVVQGFAAIGLIFAFATLVTGSAWASESWGAAWNWDPRETSVLLLFLAYLVYFVIRASISDPERARMVSNIYAIAAYAMVPVVFAAPVVAKVSLHPSFEAARQFLRHPAVLSLFVPKVLIVTVGGLLLGALASTKLVNVRELRIVRYALLAALLVYIALGVYVAAPWLSGRLAKVVDASVDSQGLIHSLKLLRLDNGRLETIVFATPVRSPISPPVARVVGENITRPTIVLHVIELDALLNHHRIVIVDHWSVAVSLILTGVSFYAGFEIAVRLAARHARESSEEM